MAGDTADKLALLKRAMRGRWTGRLRGFGS
jgi:hypothetical protein